MRAPRPDVARAALVAALVAALAIAAPLRAQQDAGGRATAPRAAAAALVHAADSAYDAGDAARAEREYERALAIDPESSRALYRLAQLRRARPEEAVRLLRRYVALEPQDAWGHLALGDALLRSGRAREAAAAYDAAMRLAPGDRDVQLARARLLARTGRTDAAIEAHQGRLAADAADAEAWDELAQQLRRAGRTRDALAARERASALSPTSRRAAAVAALRDALATAVELRASGTRDSDANGTARLGLGVTFPEAGRGRLGVSAGTRVVDGPDGRTSVRDAALAGSWRPLATTRLELSAGAVRHEGGSVLVDTSVVNRGGGTGRGPGNGMGQGRGPGNGTGTGVGSGTNGGVDTTVTVTRLTTAATSPVARARLAWRAPSGAAALDLRAARTFLDANATLVRADVVRDEIGGELDLRLAGPLRARALGRAGAVRSDVQTNRRALVGGALVLAGAPGELAGRVQRLEYAEPSASGYFAPRRAETVELGSYLERESASGATIALDLGAGAQRVTRFGEPAGTWGPALRGWLQATLPLPRAGALGVELEAYDARTPAEGVASTAGSWRYGAASVWVRMGVR